MRKIEDIRYLEQESGFFRCSVICDRVSNGIGKIYDHTYTELCELDFGTKSGESFRGLKISTFEEILQNSLARPSSIFM